jgi:hypothetical protein
MPRRKKKKKDLSSKKANDGLPFDCVIQHVTTAIRKVNSISIIITITIR